MPIQSIPRVGVKEAVYNQMMKMITSGEWKPGEKIPSESNLTTLFGVSRVTVRESIQKLVSLGIVESRQGGGTFVCALDGTQYLSAMIPYITLNSIDLMHMLEFRKIIEGSSAYLAASRATDEDIEALSENVRLMEASMKDIKKRTALDIEFHQIIANMTQNPIIARIYEILKVAWLDGMRTIVRTMGSSKALHYHALLIDAISERAPQRARAVMDEHIDTTIDAMKKTQTAGRK